MKPRKSCDLQLDKGMTMQVRKSESLSDKVARTRVRFHAGGYHSDCGPRFSLADMEAIDLTLSHTNVRIIGVTKQSDHCAYALMVETPEEHFVVQKRYSDFRKLRDQLIAISHQKVNTCNKGACRGMRMLSNYRFPKKTMQLKYKYNEKVVRERRFELQFFVQLVLDELQNAPARTLRRCEASQCETLRILKQFLTLDDTKTSHNQRQRATLVFKDFSPTETTDDDDDGSRPASPLFPITEEFEVAYL